MHLLTEKKRKAEQEEAETNMEILLEFLHRSRQQKQEELNTVSVIFSVLIVLNPNYMVSVVLC